jgi:hypothetical protein
VLRGGYGIYQLPSIGFVTNGQTSKYSVAATFSGPDGVTPAYQLDQGVPAYSYNVGPNGLPNIASSLTKPTATIQMQQLTGVIPYNQEWSLSAIPYCALRLWTFWTATASARAAASTSSIDLAQV